MGDGNFHVLVFRGGCLAIFQMTGRKIPPRLRRANYTPKGARAGRGLYPRPERSTPAKYPPQLRNRKAITLPAILSFPNGAWERQNTGAAAGAAEPENFGCIRVGECGRIPF